MIIEKLSSTKSFVYKMFFVQKQKRKGVIFKFLQFEERFRKLRFRDGLIWTVRLVTVEIKLCFQISPAWLARGGINTGG